MLLLSIGNVDEEEELVFPSEAVSVFTAAAPLFSCAIVGSVWTTTGSAVVDVCAEVSGTVTVSSALILGCLLDFV